MITIILHGYSDKADSFKEISEFLSQNGYDTLTIRLGDYISLEDHVTIPDLAKAFSRSLRESGIAVGPGSINLIVHSTGSLVAREWMTRYFLELGLPCPVRRYLMLAPANFGSPLAAMGKTMLGRVLKGWNSGFETGKHILDALEMGSPYTRNLARRDLFSPISFYEPTQCMAAVLVGSKPYREGLRRIVDKNGSDGTVFVCTANLNAVGVTLDFGKKGEETKIREWTSSAQPVAFGVFKDRDHASITNPKKGLKNLGKYILDFLVLESADEYFEYSKRCDTLTEKTLPSKPTEKIFHSYQNIAAHVEDDFGNSIEDYFLEFFEKAASPEDEDKVDELMIKIHREVLESVAVYGPDESYRSLLFDLTDLRRVLGKSKKLMFSLSAAPLSPLISFNAGSTNDVSELAVSGAKGKSFWHDNKTMIVDIVIQRNQSEEVFKIL